MSDKIPDLYLKSIGQQLRNLKNIADKAVVQVKDEELPIEIDDESNSITILMKHIAGNMTNLWTRPLAPVEEWPTRHRDLEFTTTKEDTRESVGETWNKAWNALFKTLDGLKMEDLTANMTVRGRDLTLMEVLNSQYSHYAVHVGQIVFLAKHYRVRDWNTLSVPKKR
jgi:hypothetical protein